MTKINRELEARYNGKIDFNLGTISALLISGILTLTPMRAVGFIGLGSIGGAVVASVTAKKKLLEVSSQMLSEQSHQLTQLIDSKTDTYEALFAEHNTLIEKAKNLKNIGEQVLTLQANLEQALADKSAKEQTLNQVISDLKTLQHNEKSALEQTKSATLEIIRERASLLIEKVDGKPAKEITEIVDRYTRFVDDAPSLVEVFDYLHWATDDLANCKVRFVKSSMTVRLQEYAIAYEEYQKTESIPKTQLDHERKNFQAQIAEYRLKNSQFQQSVMDTVAEIEGQTVDDDKFVTGLVNQMKGLEAEIARLSKPIKYVAATRVDMKVSNVISDFFERQGLIIDRAGSTFRDYEADLEFITDRTGRLVLASELNKHSEALQALTHLINPIDFKLDPESGLMTLKAQFYKKPKSEVSDRTKNLITPIEVVAKKIIDGMTHKPTIRIMGATGEGKGVMARYLLNQLLTQQKCCVRLHDPQDGSEQDFWGIPKVSKSGNELKQALVNIEAQMIERESNKNWAVTTLDVLDEIDTHLESKDKKEAFINLCSRIRHCGMKLMLIGQNPKVGRAGFEWSDMQQMICIYMGASAYDAIQANKQLHPKKEKLSTEYTALSEYYEKVNEILDDSCKALFGLVVILSKAPFWVELPRADSVTIHVDKMLGEVATVFKITNTKSEKIDRPNRAKTVPNPADRSAVGKTSQDFAGAETTACQEVPQGSTNSDALKPSHTAISENHGETAKTTTTICKKHPSNEL